MAVKLNMTISDKESHKGPPYIYSHDPACILNSTFKITLIRIAESLMQFFQVFEIPEFKFADLIDSIKCY